MVSGHVTGVNEFRHFADSVDDVADDVDSVIRRAVRMTGYDFVEEVVELVRKASTAKGGTFDSRTSPYSPGGTNDSSDDPFHLADRSAWLVETLGTNSVIVSPREEVEDRAKFMEYGTSAHGPTGDEPMHFWAGGTHIVVSEDGVPGEVAGVPAKHIFTRAAMILERNNTFKNNLRAALNERMAQEFGI